MKRILIAAAVLSLAVIPAAVSAWGNTGHRLIGVAAVRALPDELPAFVRASGAVADVGDLPLQVAEHLGLTEAALT